MEYFVMLQHLQMFLLKTYLMAALVNQVLILVI
jgi:hypothetical protein